MSAFGNGSEGEEWMARWCHVCVRDGDVDAGDGCVILLDAMTGSLPREWLVSPVERYVCVAFSDDPADAPRATDPSPGQIPLLPALAGPALPHAAAVERARRAMALHFPGGQPRLPRRMRIVELPPMEG